MSDKDHHDDKMHEKKLQAIYLASQEYLERSNKQLKARINLLSLAANVGLSAYTFYIVNTDETEGNTCGTSLKWFLFLVLAMHATNILQAVCKITGLKHCFCSDSKNFWMDLFEFLTVILMQVVLSTSSYCEGTGQYYVCLLINTVVYWLMLMTTVYVYLRTKCSTVSIQESEELLHANEKNPHKD